MHPVKHQVNQSTEEFENLRFLLREDLNYTLQAHNGQNCYVVEDTRNNVYYRVGETEYAFMSLLDGNTSVRQVIAILATTEQSSLSESEAQVICRWLTDNQLVKLTQGFNEIELTRSRDAKQSRTLQQWFNPLSVSLVLGDPQPFLHAIAPVSMLLFRPLGMLVWLMLVSLGLVRLLTDSKHVFANPSQVIDPSNWLWLAIVWLGCKVVHEAAHGLCCMAHGCSVHTFGINFVMFFPLPYVDVSAAWKLPNKWHRIHIAVAGVYAELAVAAMAAMIHSYTSDPWLKMQCLNTMVSAGIISLVVNMNPLLKYDGYYILSDFLEFPNLSTAASQQVKIWLKHVFCGVAPKRQSSLEFRTRIGLFAYGSLSAAWRISISLTMVLAARWLFHGAGLVLASTSAIVWLAWPAFRGLKYAIIGCEVEKPSRARFLCTTGILLCATWIAAANLNWLENLELSGVVDYVPNTPVRCEVSGFVDQIRVTQGQSVRRGDILLELTNDNVTHLFQEIELELRQSEYRADYLLSQSDIASYQAELDQQVALRTRLAEATALIEKLILRAPNDGIVIAHDIGNFPGQFLNQGEAICVIGDPTSLAIRLQIPQRYIDALTSLQGQTGRISFVGNICHEGDAPLVSLDPRGTLEILHPALSANQGGPLATQPTDSGRIQLVEPHFTCVATLPSKIKAHCASGQVVSFRVAVARFSILESIRRLLEFQFSQRS